MQNQEEKISIWFIINPISGGKRNTIRSNKILKHLDLFKLEPSFYYTEYRGHAVQIADKAVEEKVNIVCAVGGDGTIHEIGLRLIHSQTALAIIPRGSGNGIANHLGVSKKIKKAIDSINQYRIDLMDTVSVNDSFFIGTAGYGIDAIIAEKFDSDKKRGLKTYLKHSFKEFIKLKPIQIKIETHGKMEEIEAFMLCIANTSEFGNRFIISPNSSVKDGKIEIIIVRPFPKWKGPLVAAKFFGKRPRKSRYIETKVITEAKIELMQSTAHYDGESVQENKSVVLKVIPSSLKVILPIKKMHKI